MRLTLSPQGIGRVLLLAVLAMTAASAAAQALRRNVASEPLREGLRLFKLSDENTLPAFFSSVMLLGCAGLLAVIARLTRRRGGAFARHWWLLAVIFTYLSVDEAIALHERLNDPMRRALQAGGFLHYPWVLVGMVAVLLVGAACARFVAHLHPAVRRLAIAAAALYVGGAIGAEMVSAKFASTVGTGTIGYGVASLAEEFMEMSGVAIFVQALLVHLREQSTVLHVALSTDDRPETGGEPGAP